MIYTNFDDIPKERYSIVLADPAWRYEDTRKGAVNHYEVMDIQDIYNLPVNDIAKEDAVLLLWCTYPMLVEGLETIKRWGFQYKTCGFTWLKKNQSHGWFIGLGHYTRSNAEICLVATKGKGIKVIDHSITQIHTSVVYEHSKKPDAIRNKIVKLFGNLPRIELFARTHPAGWDCWGNQISLNNMVESYV